MKSRIKLWIAAAAALSMLTVISALAETIYLPQVIKEPTNTPTPTATRTLTPTPTRTPTRTPTPSRTPSSGVFIVTIVPYPSDQEYIELENIGSGSVNMDEWYIKVESKPGIKYVFDGFTLAGGKTVRVWSRAGRDTATDLYWNATIIDVWKDARDCGYLRTKAGLLADKYCYGEDLLNGR